MSYAVPDLKLNIGDLLAVFQWSVGACSIDKEAEPCGKLLHPVRRKAGFRL